MLAAKRELQSRIRTLVLAGRPDLVLVVPRIAQELIEQIAAANDIVDVVGSYSIGLKRAGSTYKALCPFHQEKSPSFTVNPQRQIFKCFGCGAGGGVFRFVMDYEHVDFITAAKKLAERVGIRVVEEELSAEDQHRYDLRRRVLALHAEAANFFHHHLMKTPEAHKAREYLKGRGINAEIAKGWKLGYAPDSWDAFRDYALHRGFSVEEIAESGLISARDGTLVPAAEMSSDVLYDRFRDRVMFPICNDNGEVIAFSGRVLNPDAKAAKYVNSPETMLFTKGAVLFGIHRTKRALIDKKTAIVCEGQLDLITTFENGIQNVTAAQGTAFTGRQAHILKRYVEEVVLCYDSDAAGQKAAERSLPHLLDAGLAVRVAEMPEGEDPDSMIRGKGSEAFLQQITTAKDYFDFQIDRLAASPEFDSARGRMQAARKMAEAISLIGDAVLRETVMNRVTRRLEVSVQEFVKLLKAPKAGRTDDAPREAETDTITLDPAIRLLAHVLLTSAEARAWVLAEPWENLLTNDPDSGLLLKLLRGKLDPANPASVTSFLATLPAAEETALSSLANEKTPDHPMAIVQDCWHELERRQLRRRTEAIHARLRISDLPEDELVKLQKEFLDLQRRLLDIARPFSPPL